MPYPSDLSDAEWLFDVENYGTNRKHSVRELLNAVFYLTKTGMTHFHCRSQSLPMAGYRSSHCCLKCSRACSASSIVTDW